MTITTPGIWIVEADPANTWLTYTPTTPQSTDGTVDWTAEANTDVAPRQAILHVNGEAFTLNQDVASTQGQPQRITTGGIRRVENGSPQGTRLRGCRRELHGRYFDEQTWQSCFRARRTRQSLIRFAVCLPK